MDTSIVVLIVVVAVVLIALLVALPRLRKAKEERRVHAERQRLADRHHAEADAKDAHAQQIEARAEAQGAEVELAERQAEARRAEVDVQERKAAAARAEAQVSRTTAARAEEGHADHELDLPGRDHRDADVREARDDVDPRQGQERVVTRREDPRV